MTTNDINRLEELGRTMRGHNLPKAKAPFLTEAAPAPCKQDDKAWAGPECEAAINERGARPDSWKGGFRHGWSEGRAAAIREFQERTEGERE